MNLPPFPEGFLPRSPEERLMLAQWGEQCRAMYKEDAERYRFLRGHAGTVDGAYGLYWETSTGRRNDSKDAASLDFAVDVARRRAAIDAELDDGWRGCTGCSTPNDCRTHGCGVTRGLWKNKDTARGAKKETAPAPLGDEG